MTPSGRCHCGESWAKVFGTTANIANEISKIENPAFFMKKFFLLFSYDPAVIRVPSGESATELAEFVSSINVARFSPVGISHIGLTQNPFISRGR
jgi:hypothetical protein